MTNVEFLKGYIEDIPLPGRTVDVVISNCVINLSTDKRGGVHARYTGCYGREVVWASPTSSPTTT